MYINNMTLPWGCAFLICLDRDRNHEPPPCNKCTPSSTTRFYDYWQLLFSYTIVTATRHTHTHTHTKRQCECPAGRKKNGLWSECECPSKGAYCGGTQGGTHTKRIQWHQPQESLQQWCGCGGRRCGVWLCRLPVWAMPAHTHTHTRSLSLSLCVCVCVCVRIHLSILW